MEKKYNIIYVDPPWQYKAWSAKGTGRSPEQHYNVMTKEDIQNLPVSQIADKNAILFMWATYPCLEEALELIPKWGFKYKTVAFTWVKRNKKSPSWFWGLGYWTRSNPEICLLATRGNISRVSKSVHSVVDTAIEQHSKKPEIVRDRIVELVGDLPRIELFARQKTEGWDVWGNEVESDIELRSENGKEI